MKRRLFACILAAIMLLSLLSGCGKEKKKGPGGTEASEDMSHTEPQTQDTVPQEAENTADAYEVFVNSDTNLAHVTAFDGSYGTIPNCAGAWVLPDRERVLYATLPDTDDFVHIGHLTLYVAKIDSLDSPTQIYSGPASDIDPGPIYATVNVGDGREYVLDYDTLAFHNHTEGDRLEDDDGSGIIKRHSGYFYIETRSQEEKPYPHYYLETKDHGNILLDEYVFKVIADFSIYDPETDEYFFSLTGADDRISICYRCKDGQITEMIRAKEGSQGIFVPRISNGIVSIMYIGPGEATTLLRPKGSTEFVTVDNPAILNAAGYPFGTDKGLYTVCSLNPEDPSEESLCFIGNDGSFSVVLNNITYSRHREQNDFVTEDRLVYCDGDGNLCTARVDGAELKEQHLLVSQEEQLDVTNQDTYVRYLEKANALLLKTASGCYLTSFDGKERIFLGDSGAYHDLGTSADEVYLFAVTGRGRQLMQWRVSDLMEAASADGAADPLALGIEIDHSVHYTTVTSGKEYLDPEEILYMTCPTSGREFTFKLKNGGDIKVLGTYGM